jgi:hypothetical protein
MNRNRIFENKFTNFIYCVRDDILILFNWADAVSEYILSSRLKRLNKSFTLFFYHIYYLMWHSLIR